MKITIDRAFEPVTVDLWGHEFKTVPVTRSVQARIDERRQAFLDAEGEDANVKALAEMIDEQLVSSVDSDVKPSTVIVKKWEQDQLGVDQLLAFVDELGEARRPT